MKEAPLIKTLNPEVVRQVLTKLTGQVDTLLKKADKIPYVVEWDYDNISFVSYKSNISGKTVISAWSLFSEARGMGDLGVNELLPLNDSNDPRELSSQLRSKGIDMDTIVTIAIGEHIDSVTISEVDELQSKTKNRDRNYYTLYVLGKKMDGTLSLDKYIQYRWLHIVNGQPTYRTLPTISNEPNELITNTSPGSTIEFYYGSEIEIGDFGMLTFALREVEKRLDAYFTSVGTQESTEIE